MFHENHLRHGLFSYSQCVCTSFVVSYSRLQPCQAVCSGKETHASLVYGAITLDTSIAAICLILTNLNIDKSESRVIEQ